MLNYKELPWNIQNIKQASKPAFPWAGGKRRLLKDILSNLPKSWGTYIEPFIGGAAVFLELQEKYPGPAIINDFNPEIVNTYRVLRDNPVELIYMLKELEDFRSKEDFIDIRNMKGLSDPISRAARFMYITKLSFGSLYKENESGDVKSSYGGENMLKKRLMSIKEAYNIQEISKALKGVKITQGDFFKVTMSNVKEGDFVYLDPPYIPVGGSEWDYTSSGFDMGMQKKVVELMDYIDDIGAYFLVSNSSASEAYKLYEAYEILEVDIRRGFSSHVESRGVIKELLVKNY